jgi:hypothetical protein
MIEHDPREDYDDEPKRWRFAANPDLLRVASALWWVGLIQLVTAQAMGGFILLFLWSMGAAINDRGAIGPEVAIAVMVWLVGTLSSAFVIWCAASARRGHRYILAMSASALTALSFPAIYLFPVISPIGVWALVVLFRHDIRSQFLANRSERGRA